MVVTIGMLRVNCFSFVAFRSYRGFRLPKCSRTLCHLHDFLVLRDLHVYSGLLWRIHLPPVLCSSYFIAKKEMEVS